MGTLISTNRKGALTVRGFRTGAYNDTSDIFLPAKARLESGFNMGIGLPRSRLGIRNSGE